MFLNDFDLDLGFLRGFPLTIGQRGANIILEYIKRDIRR
jgi:hypothetical protein